MFTGLWSPGYALAFVSGVDKLRSYFIFTVSGAVLPGLQKLQQ
jgi:hypothetical protein